MGEIRGQRGMYGDYSCPYTIAASEFILDEKTSQMNCDATKCRVGLSWLMWARGFGPTGSKRRGRAYPKPLRISQTRSITD